jgi:hypothetical protein
MEVSRLEKNKEIALGLYTRGRRGRTVSRGSQSAPTVSVLREKRIGEFISSIYPWWIQKRNDLLL